MKTTRLLLPPGGAVYILPASDAHGVSLAVLGHMCLYKGTLTTPEGPRDVIVGEGRQHDSMAIASLMWRYGFRGTLMATPFRLWLVYPKAPSLLRGVRLRTKQPWRLTYGLVDCDLPR